MEPPVNASSPFFEYNTLFEPFGTQHLLMVSLIVLSVVGVPFVANRFLDARRRLYLSRIIAIIVSLTIVGWMMIRVALGDFDAQTDLPLHVCNLAALLMPVLMWNPSRRVHEVLYFLVLAGTLQGVITPHLFDAFPPFTFFRYWIVHGGLILCAVYYTLSLGLYPDRRSIFKALGWLNVYAVVIFFVNLPLGSNYFYVMRKPPTASLLDWFGPWPWYILVCEGLALILFALIYAPLELIRKRKQPA